MTSPGPDLTGPEPATPDPSDDRPAPGIGAPEEVPSIVPAAGSGPPPARLGATTFTIEGRRAPALFVIGWLASIMGLGIILIAVLATAGVAPFVLLAGLALLAVGLVAGAGSQGIERRAAGVLPYQGPSPLLVFAASIPVSLLAVVLIAVPFVVAGIPVDGPVGQLASVVVQTIVYAALIRLLVVDVGALSWLEMGLRRFDGRAVAEMLRGAAWAIPVIVVTIPVSLVLVGLLGVTPTSPLPPTGETSGFVLQFIAGAIIAPLGEELMFRGLATTAWVRGLGVTRGVTQAALLFAFAHVLNVTGTSAGEALGLAVIGFATRVPIALALGWLFVRRGTLWAPIGLHMAFNGLLLIVGELAARSV